jgi:ABC-2 type transport system ATP-binding protein
MPAIEVHGLVKTYGARRAVDDVSFEVACGEIFALLGPNGAGKTTTVEILEGYRSADAGQVRVLERDPWRDGAHLKPRIGVMLQDGGLYPAITPREAIDLFARFYQNVRPTAELLRLVGLEDAMNTRYRRLSGGQKQRLALALALVGNPELVFLDEPTAGLDPQGRRISWEIIHGLKNDGVTVLLTTHYLDEAERLADRVAIMNTGKLAALGTPRELVRGDNATVRLATASPLSIDALNSLPAARGAHAEDEQSFIVKTDCLPQLLVEITTMLRDRGIELKELRVGGGTLEDVYLELTGTEGTR